MVSGAMTEFAQDNAAPPRPGVSRLLPPPPLFLLQPILARVVRRVAELHPSLFDRPPDFPFDSRKRQTQQLRRAHR